MLDCWAPPIGAKAPTWDALSSTKVSEALPLSAHSISLPKSTTVKTLEAFSNISSTSKGIAIIGKAVFFWKIPPKRGISTCLSTARQAPT